MKVLLISANTERINMPILPLGLGCIYAATRSAGHEVKLLDLMGAADIPAIITQAMKSFPPQVIGISVRNIDDQKAEDTRFLLDQVKEVISCCRNLSNAPIVLGGAGYSIFPESALKYLGADMGIQGEGEAAFLALLERLMQGSPLSGVPGLYVRGRGLQAERSFVEDLDSLPFPAPDVWSPSYVNDPEFWMPFQTRRGCSFGCNYCSTGAIEGARLRKRSPEIVAESIARYVEAGFKRFYFTDNTFNIPALYAGEICRSLINKGLGMAWRCIIYPMKLDGALVENMAKAGCKEVSLGFESGCERILHVMNKRFKPNDVRLTSDMFAKFGIRRMGFIMLGGPGETRESVEESLAFADSLHLDMLKVSVGIRIYPNTALAKAAVEDGIIAPDDNLLSPKFYVVKGLEDWIRATVKDWMSRRPNWVS